MSSLTGTFQLICWWMLQLLASTTQFCCSVEACRVFAIVVSQYLPWLRCLMFITTGSFSHCFPVDRQLYMYLTACSAAAFWLLQSINRPAFPVKDSVLTITYLSLCPLVVTTLNGSEAAHWPSPVFCDSRLPLQECQAYAAMPLPLPAYYPLLYSVPTLWPQVWLSILMTSKAQPVILPATCRDSFQK